MHRFSLGLRQQAHKLCWLGMVNAIFIHPTHLHPMKDAGLLGDRQKGRWVYYRIQPESLNALQGWLHELTRSCETAASSCCE